MSERPRIVFVDDEARVLSGLRRQLHARRAEWEMSFVEGGPQCLAELARVPADVVVSDMRMPGMDGAQLLAKVAEGWPTAARLVLSGHADPDRVQVARSCAHRYLNKPCPPELLEAEVRRALWLRSALADSGWEVAERIWGTPPSRFESCVDTLTAQASSPNGEGAAERLVSRFGQDAEVAARLSRLVGPALPEAAAVNGDGASLAAAIGAKHLPMLLMGLRFHDVFLARPGADPSAAHVEPGTRFERAVALAARAAGLAAAERLGAETRLFACVAALLEATWSGAPDGEAFPSRQARELLEFLLPTWGLPDPVVLAVANWKDPAACPPANIGPLAVLVGAELQLAWEGAHGAIDPARELALVGWLQSRGWQVRPGASVAPPAQPATRP